MDFIKNVESETILNAYAKSGHCIVCFCDADRIFADVSLPLRSLSDRCFGRNHMRNHMRLRLVVVHQEVFSEEARLGSAFDRKSSWKMQFCCAILE